MQLGGLWAKCAQGLVVGVIAPGLFGSASSLEAKEQYGLKVDAHSVSPGRLEVDISTNIPGTVEVMANIGLRNQGSNDLYVGTDSEKVVLTHGAGKITFDVSKLPRGKYEAEVGFYPNWGFKDAASRASGITHDITVNRPVEFALQTNISAQQQIDLKQKKIWAIDHALPETAWRPSVWTSHLGNFVKLPVTDDGWDPSIVEDYYFKSIDMRVRVNKHLHQILTLEDGHGDAKSSAPAFQPKEIDRGLMISFEPLVEDAIRRNLKSPDDAKFDGFFGKVTGDRSAIVCGTVNAKNSFGAYGGGRSFVSFVTWGNGGVDRGASVNLVYADGTAAFRKVWKLCQ